MEADQLIRASPTQGAGESFKALRCGAAADVAAQKPEHILISAQPTGQKVAVDRSALRI